MLFSPLLLMSALAFGHGPAVDQRPYAASRSNAIIEAARDQSAQAAPPEATPVRYPSADGDILAGMGQAIVIPPLQPVRPYAAKFPPMSTPSADRRGPDGTGLLGGPKD